LPDDFVKVDDRAIKEFQQKVERWCRVAPEEVKKALKLGGEKVRAEVQFRHLNGPKMPRGVGDPNNATLAVRTGRLKGSIALRVMALESGKFSAQIGTNVPYARKHEYGLEGMPERPFLRPSIEKKRPEVFDTIAKAFMESYGK